MIEITAEIRALIDKAAAGVELAGDEYIDPADGLIHCKKCGGQRQTVVPCFGKPGYFMPRCICQCQREAEEQRKAAEERQRRMERIKRRKAQGLQDRYLYDYTFANDNGQNPLMDKARAYVENWKEAYKNNTGLLLFGDVGTGKSFFAGCIANALLDRDVPVLMTNFPTILNRLTGMFSEDRAEFIASFDEYELMTQDEIAVMDGGKCILQLRGVRPFLSDKYDITKHPNYKYLSDFDKRNAFDVERYMSTRPAIVKPDEAFDIYEIDLSDEDAAAEE